VVPPSAWQVLCELEAWLVTQIARRPQRREPSGEDEGDLLAGQREYGRGIPGQDCASQLAAVTRWYQDDQRDQARLRAVVWGQRPAPALGRAAGATAGDPDWTERVASLLEVFAGSCRWPLDYLTPPGPAS
jgi:hypothetical protein